MVGSHLLYLHMSTPHFEIGLAGLGVVGAGVYKHLHLNKDLLAERTGAEIEVVRAVVRDRKKKRFANGDPSLPELSDAKLTTEWTDLINDPDIQIIIELFGGIETPLKLIKAALDAGKCVITGNKALLAHHGQELFAKALETQTPIFFEASTAGGIPIIKVIREAFVANHIISIHGIINGTSNYILTRMTEAGLDFGDALKEAQAAGYAEADPTLDINGWDAAHKAIILASLAYGFWVPIDKVFVEGIERVTATDIRFANELGYHIKLLAIIKAGPNAANGDPIEVRVHPTLIPKDHVLASVNGVFNAIAVRGDVVGETLFYGRGAGQDPTASAVISDIADAVDMLTHLPQEASVNTRGPAKPRPKFGFMAHGIYGNCLPIDEIESEYYLRIVVDDEPGVLSKVTGILGAQGISILSAVQPEVKTSDARAQLILMLNRASHRQIEAAQMALEALTCVHGAAQLLRVERFKN